MQTVHATRAALLERRARIRLAERGRDLLQDKRKELLRAFREIAEGALDASERLGQTSAQARAELRTSEALDGPDAVWSAGWASDDQVAVTARVQTIMGVRVPVIEHEPVGRPRTERGYALSSTHPRIDRVAARYEAVVDVLLELASTELRLRRLGEEIGKTTRRANALEYVVLPDLEAERRAIALKLQERERESTFALRRVKAHRERRTP